MASVTFDAIDKTYQDGTKAVHELSLEVRDGEFLVFVGPSGCGKTTALRMVAGLEEISGGELRIGDSRVNEMDPQGRDIAMVFQNYALYPHLSVFGNIAFPLASQHLPKAEIRERVEATAKMLDLSEHLQRKPRNLSGGQRQRVAMGRAIIREPRVFLMDEPLSNLDAKLRVQMRGEITRLQRRLGVTTIYVTHDQVEAMTMGDRIAVMRKGLLQQHGTAEELYDTPTNLFVATFVGSPSMNLVEATVRSEAGGLGLQLGDTTVGLPGAAAPKGLADYRDRRVAVGLRPEHISEPSAANQNHLRLSGHVGMVEMLGSDRLVYLRFDADPVVTDDTLEIAADVDATRAEELRTRSEREVYLVARFKPETHVAANEPCEVDVRADKLHFFDLESGSRIG